jgi:hypothetical protein
MKSIEIFICIRCGSVKTHEYPSTSLPDLNCDHTNDPTNPCFVIMTLVHTAHLEKQ